MIKVRLTNPQNMKCFGGLLITHQYGLLSDYSIELTNSDDYDYEFVDMDKFIKKGLSIEESAKYGIENMSKKTGDYFLFHGGGATDLLGAYEVFTECDAPFLFKKALMRREDYKEKTVLNKWWFGKGSTCDAGYDIPQDVYDRIKLTGYTVCHNWPHMQNLQPISEKDIDVCAVYMATHPPGDYNYGVETGQYYTKHRRGGWDELEKISDRYNIVAQKLPPDVTQNVMQRSKIGISPYGQCEVCYRDLEIIQWGGLLIKPDMSKILTEPDFYKPMETYVPVKPDWSNLNETIEKILANFKDYEYIIDNSRKKLVEMFSYHNVGRYWYDFFSNLSGVENE